MLSSTNEDHYIESCINKSKYWISSNYF